MEKTLEQYKQVVSEAKNLFIHKSQDYGTSWRILRLPSLTDLISIKAERIRSIQEKGVNLVGESIHNEFVGILNYCVIALIVLHAPEQAKEEIEISTLTALYEEQIERARSLMQKKNHDYGEAWRKMRISSITDLILMKILRTKQIEDNQGKTVVSEGIEANYLDMLNYAIFALIKENEAAST